MKLSKILYAALAFGAIVLATSCDDSDSYADLLTDQDHYVNNFLADHRVELDIPADTVFVTADDFVAEGEMFDALSSARKEEILKQVPFYRLDDDATMYMQVINAGTKDNKVSYDEQIYFRYTRYGLASYIDGKLPTGAGNNITLSPAWFRYGNYQIQSSYNWGVGIQTPLDFLPIDCKVRIVIKAQNGFTQETADVMPYLYVLTYERRQ